MRYVSSFAQDVVHAVSRGQFLTAKHILLGAGLHSLTGQKLPIKLLARYGSACSYEMVQKVETAQAELVQNMRLRNFPLGLVPASQTSSVLTFFWWDNFDCKKETIEGSIHTCHGVAFQENSNGQSLEKNWLQMLRYQAIELFLLLNTNSQRDQLSLTKSHHPYPWN